MKPVDEPSGPREAAAAPMRSLARSLRETGWAFLGIRKSGSRNGIGALQLIAVALAALVLFVLGLIALVHGVVPD